MRSDSAPNCRRLLRLRVAAEYLSLSTWTLRHIVQEGEIPIISYGPSRPWLFDRADLDQWIEKHKQTL